jgi:hypothetical protein
MILENILIALLSAGIVFSITVEILKDIRELLES